MSRDTSWIKILPGSVYYLDYRTYITLESGMERFYLLQDKFEKYPKDKPLKLIMDARGFTYDSEETHLTMSKIGREFFLNRFTNIKVAIVNDKYESALSEQESWFTNLDDALNWIN